jgi:hypothetical protein
MREEGRQEFAQNRRLDKESLERRYVILTTTITRAGKADIVN